MTKSDYLALRTSIAEIPADASNDAVGDRAPKLHDMYAPEAHAAAINPSTPIVLGARGTGKSFWSGVLGQQETRSAAARAYPNLGLDRVKVYFGFTGVGGLESVGIEAINTHVREDADSEDARAFWWATLLRAIDKDANSSTGPFSSFIERALDWELRESAISDMEAKLRGSQRTILIVYDALDRVATTWPRRHLLTEALLAVVWSMRAYRSIKVKLFLRPDQIDDDALRFVELPKLRAGAVRLTWSEADLYGLLYARLALSERPEAKRAFEKLLRGAGLSIVNRDAILARRWSLSTDHDDQLRVMQMIAGDYMASGPYGYKKGRTYDWPLTHLADAFNEVTPRSFLELMITAAKVGPAPPDKVITPDGIRHGLRAASRTRVDQLHQEFPWIKAVLAPLAGLLLPQEEKFVFQAWRRANTVKALIEDARGNGYLPPFEEQERSKEKDLFEALRRIGVMFRRKDDRIDMPDLFRVAAKLLKKGGTAPI